MTIFTIIEDDFKAIVTKIDTFLSPELKAIEAYIKANIGQDVLEIAKVLYAGFVAGSSWTALEALLIEEAAKIGKTLIQGAATVALNVAQSTAVAVTPVVAEPITPIADTPTKTPSA